MRKLARMKMIKTSVWIPLLLVSVLFTTPHAMPPAHASGGIVCIADPSTDPGSCPSTPALFTGNVGSVLTVAVNIQDSDLFNGFDIRVKADPAILRPTSIDLTGSLIGEPRFIVVQNVDAVSGTVRLAIAALAYVIPGPATGNLFTMTYDVIANSSGTDIYFPEDQLDCGPEPNGDPSSSVEGTSICVAVVSPFASPCCLIETVQPETVQTATFSNLAISVSKFFTDPDLNPLPLDQFGNPKVDVVLASGRVKSTNPGQVLAWVKVENTGGASFRSIIVNEALPVDWGVSPPWTPGLGAIHVYFAFANGTRVEITDPGSITVATGNPESVILSVSDLASTAAASALEPGDSILLSVKIAYMLKGTSQSAMSYPRHYTDTTIGGAWTGTNLTGAAISDTASGTFIAYAKVLGDATGDFRVDIFDAAVVAYAYGSRPGGVKWNANADFDYNGVIDILDAAVVAYYYGTKS